MVPWSSDRPYVSLIKLIEGRYGRFFIAQNLKGGEENMSPEIRNRDGVLIADVPDTNGLHRMLDGSPLYVKVRGIEAHQARQILVVNGPGIGGERILQLSQEGIGDTGQRETRRIRAGDQKEPWLDIRLKERPIRTTYSAKEGYYEGAYHYAERESQYNPYWVRNSGRR